MGDKFADIGSSLLGEYHGPLSRAAKEAARERRAPSKRVYILRGAPDHAERRERLVISLESRDP